MNAPIAGHGGRTRRRGTRAPARRSRRVSSPCPSATSGPSGRRCSASCCGWTHCVRRRGSLSLLALDFIALFGAILTALCLKAAVRDAWDFHVSFQQAKDYFPLVYLVTVLLFARSGLYTNRAERPGLARIVACLFQTMVLVFVFAVVNGNEYSSYYIFYGSLFFAVAYVTTLRFVYERVTGVLLRAAGYQRRTVLVGTGEHIEDVASALRDGSDTSINVIGFVSITPRPDNGLVSLGTLEHVPEVARDAPRRRGHHRRPRLPPAAGGRARRPVPPARRDASGSRRRRWRSWCTGRSSCRASRCRCSSCARPCSRASTTCSSGPSTSSAPSLLLFFLSPLLPGDRDRDQAQLARLGVLRVDPARHRRPAVLVLEVPHDVPRRRPAPGGPRVDQRGQRRAVQDQATTRG